MQMRNKYVTNLQRKHIIYSLWNFMQTIQLNP